MGNKVNFKIVTPERVLLKSEIKQVSVPTTLGEITILPGHIPLVANLKPGQLKIVDEEGERLIAVAGGFVEVRSGNNVVVLADAAEHMEEIDLERAEEARRRAQKVMAEESADSVKFTEAASAMERALTRIRLARRRKYRDVGRQQETS